MALNIATIRLLEDDVRSTLRNAAAQASTQTQQSLAASAAASWERFVADLEGYLASIGIS